VELISFFSSPQNNAKVWLVGDDTFVKEWRILVREASGEVMLRMDSTMPPVESSAAICIGSDSCQLDAATRALFADRLIPIVSHRWLTDSLALQTLATTTDYML